jgi:hypothetical protein
MECGHLLSKAAAKCVNCGAGTPFGAYCELCGAKDKFSNVASRYHSSCKESILAPLKKNLICPGCNQVIGEFKDEYLDHSKRMCKHCGSRRVFMYQGMPVVKLKNCINCGLQIIAPFHQSHNSEMSLHDVCLPFYEKKYPELAKEIRLLKMKDEAEDRERNYLSYKDNIDRAIKIMEEWVDIIDGQSSRKIEYWRDRDRAFVLWCPRFINGSNANRGIIFNFRGMHFEIVFWSSSDAEYFDSYVAYGSKKIRTDSITKAHFNVWLYWLHTGEPEPVHLLNAEGRKNEKADNGCLIVVASLIGLLVFLAILDLLF